MLLPLWASGFALGITAVLCGGQSAALAVAAAAAVVAVWRTVRRSPVLAVTALAVALGAVAGRRALPAEAQDQDEDDRPRAVRATVRRGPDPLDGGAGGDPQPRVRLWLDLVTVDGQTAAGVVALAAPGPAARGVAPGDLVAFEAPLRVPVGLANPGLPDARLAAAAQGIHCYASLGPRQALRRVRAGPPGPRRLAWRLREALDGAMAGKVSGPALALLRTVVLGERAGVDARVEDGFRAAGATHVLSVSGLHLAAVAAIVFFVVRRSAGLSPWLALRVRPARIAAAAALPAVALYTLVTGEAVATERSAWMALAALGAGLAGRPFSLAGGIALAALVLLVRQPLLLLDISFQLSFASVIALGLFAGRLAPRTPAAGASRGRRVLGWLGRFAAATGAAGLATAPLVAHHFGEVTPAAPLGNLALVPLVEMVVLPVGLGGAVLGAIHPLAGAVPLALADRAARLTLGVAEIFRRGAPVLLVRAPDALETAALVTAATGLLAALARLGGVRRPWAWGAAGALALACGSLGARDVARRTSDEVRVTFLDVGQGDAAVVEGPRGFVAVIDGGGAYDDSFDTGARVVEPFLRARGIGRVDLVVLSHPHPDHLNGLMRVLGRFDVGALWTSGDDGRNPRYLALRALARQRGIPTPQPAGLARDGMELVPLGPWLDDRIAAPPGTTINDASLVVRLGYAGRAVLFPGDLEADGEGELLGRAGLGLAVASEVIKVPHHGSRTSSTPELLEAVRPRLAVIPLGRHNHFHFPRPEVLARYGDRHIRVLRTDLHGAVTLRLHRDGRWDATCARPCR